MALPAGVRADHPRPGQGHRHLRRGRHRGAARRDRRARRASDRGDRGPADGRHERRRRPLRRRQDVPPAGGEVGPGDEEGGRLPDPLHRAGEARQPGVRHRQGDQRHHRDGHGQGRRPRHRQEHRRRRAAVQQLRGRRPRGHGAGPEDPRHRQGGRRRPDRALGADHPVPGRDGQLRDRDAARRARPAAADRRRHHVPCPHRGQGRPEVRRPGGVGQGRLPVRAHRRSAARRRAAQGPARGPAHRLRRPACPPRDQAGAPQADPRGRAGEPHAHRLGRLPAAGAEAARRARARRLRPRRAARLHRLAALLQRLGDEGEVPRHPQQPGHRRGGAQAVRRRAGHARPAHRGASG